MTATTKIDFVLGNLENIPTNHNPAFAPVIDPTLATGVEAIATAALNDLA
jgi:hippurate hydrolase